MLNLVVIAAVLATLINCTLEMGLQAAPTAALGAAQVEAMLTLVHRVLPVLLDPTVMELP